VSEPPPAEPGGRARWAGLIGIAISVVSLAGVVWWASRQEAPQLPSGGAEIAALAGSIVAYAIATLVRGERWQRLLVDAGGSPARADSYSLTVVGYMGNNVLPARGGDAMRVAIGAPRTHTGVRETIGTLVAERVLDAVTLLLLYALLAYAVLRGIDVPSGSGVALALGIVAAVAVTVTVVYYLSRQHEVTRRVVGFVSPMADATRRLRGAHGAVMALMTLVIWTFEATTYFAAGAAVGFEMTPFEALYIVAVASIFVLIPSGPGYLGTLDAAILFGARAAGAGGGLAVSFLLMVRFVILVPITLAGLALLVMRYGRRGAWRTAT
jgi:glycosyltransferase 2 family protein